MVKNMKCKRCGKENVDPVYPHTCTPLALVLAEKIERANAGVYSQALYEEYTASARELRRLHFENEALREALQALLDDYKGCSCPPDDLYCPRNRAIAALQGETK